MAPFIVAEYAYREGAYDHRPSRSHLARRLTAIIERSGDGYVALCPEVDIASQGASVADARSNLQEALELFFETASPDEVRSRVHGEVYVTQVEIGVG